MSAPSLLAKAFARRRFVAARAGQIIDLILVKIFATALALSEVITQPQAVKTHFDAVADQDKVVQIRY